MTAVPGSTKTYAVFGWRDASHVVVAALQRLSPMQRAVIVLRYYEDYSEREIAETLGISAGTVKSTASDGIRRLRELLGPGYPYAGGPPLPGTPALRPTTGQA